MDGTEFILQVQQRARLESTERAQLVIQATLETLAEHLNYHTADNLAVQLPPAIGRHLRTDVPERQRLSPDLLFRRIAQKEECSLSEARRHARVVLDVLQEALTFGAAEHLRQQFTVDFAPLFDPRYRDEFLEDRGR